MAKGQKKNGLFQKIITIIEVALVVVCLAVSIVVITNSNKIQNDGDAKYAKFMTVQSDSMTPTIKESALVITQKPDKEDGEFYDLGTIVSFVDNANGVAFFNTHRIVGYRFLVDGVSGIQTYYLDKSTGIDTWAEFSSANAGVTFHSYVTRGDKYTVEFGDENLSNFAYSKDGVDVTDKDDTMYHQNDDIIAVYKGKIGGVGSILKWLRSGVGFIITVLVPLFALFVINIISVVKMIIKSRVEKVKKESAVDELATKRKAIEDYLISIGLSEEDAKAKALEQFPMPTETTESVSDVTEPSTESVSTITEE